MCLNHRASKQLSFKRVARDEKVICFYFQSYFKADVFQPRAR